MGKVQLIYRSRMVDISEHVLEDIVLKASTNNHLNGVHGLLLRVGYDNLQVLEGERKVVAETFARIAKDNRHTDIEMLRFADIRVPAFEGYYCCDTAVMPDSMRGLDLDSLDIYSMDGTIALVWLRKIYYSKTGPEYIRQYRSTDY